MLCRKCAVANAAVSNPIRPLHASREAVPDTSHNATGLKTEDGLSVYDVSPGDGDPNPVAGPSDYVGPIDPGNLPDGFRAVGAGEWHDIRLNSCHRLAIALRGKKIVEVAALFRPYGWRPDVDDDGRLTGGLSDDGMMIATAPTTRFESTVHFRVVTSRSDVEFRFNEAQAIEVARRFDGAKVEMVVVSGSYTSRTTVWANDSTDPWVGNRQSAAQRMGLV